eukprot:TRINITY_DN10746_c0_g1_i10.p1 TRINITY_DN10746_c0_g1~~TRINITY_DN10746_c0_g1_i10.p1  ORF type:complete len:159 (-),score=13.89 TRINITY_DN10746_c0_g1_i10:393-869(-)
MCIRDSLSIVREGDIGGLLEEIIQRIKARAEMNEAYKEQTFCLTNYMTNFFDCRSKLRNGIKIKPIIFNASSIACNVNEDDYLSALLQRATSKYAMLGKNVLVTAKSKKAEATTSEAKGRRNSLNVSTRNVFVVVIVAQIKVQSRRNKGDSRGNFLCY